MIVPLDETPPDVSTAESSDARRRIAIEDSDPAETAAAYAAMAGGVVEGVGYTQPKMDR